jgi:4-hydroxy-tetrahydrodipicolinate synthase
MSAKYFLKKRGLHIRTISRAHALELTPEQKNTLDEIHESFLSWCDTLNIKPSDSKKESLSDTTFDPAI